MSADILQFPIQPIRHWSQVISVTPVTSDRRLAPIDLVKAVNKLKELTYQELMERKIEAAMRRADRLCTEGDLEGESDEIAYANELYAELQRYRRIYEGS